MSVPGDDDLLRRVRTAWEEITATPLPPSGTAVAVAPGSRAAPPGWVGVLRLGPATLVTAPDGPTASRVTRAFGAGPPPAEDLEAWAAALAAVETLGPASLAYLRSNVALPAHEPASPADAEAVAGLLRRCPDDDVDESGVEGVTSQVWGLRRDGAVVAAAGYRHWPGGLAHLCVLVDPAHRGAGLARHVSAAAAREALDEGLAPQWRARVEPSRRVARSLGFLEIGTQLSVRPG